MSGWDNFDNPLAQLNAVADEFLERAQEDSSFSITPVDYFPPSPIVHLVTSKRIIVMGLENGSIVRTNEAEEPEVFEVSKQKVHKVFLDPSACHLLISMVDGENYYMHAKWKRTLRTKIRGVIDCVSWEKSTTDIVAIFLFGTKGGTIHEAGFEAKEGLLSTPILTERNLKLLFTLPIDKDNPITGLAKETFQDVLPMLSTPSVTVIPTTKHFIMVTTPSKIFAFYGGPSYEAVFQQNQTQDLKPIAVLPTIPSSLIAGGELQLFVGKSATERDRKIAKAFAMLGSPGIYYGDLIFTPHSLGQSTSAQTLISDAKLCELKPPPRSFVLTEFHFIVLWGDQLKAISRITNETVYEFKFKKLRGPNMNSSRSFSTASANPSVPELVGLAHDPSLEVIFAYSPYVIHEVKIKDEDKNVWSQYLKENQFDNALKYCKSLKQKDIVNIKCADYYFDSGQLAQSAKAYASSSKPFEEVVLKFHEIGSLDSLRIYLTYKLQNLPARDRTQQTLLATWLTELYLDKLNAMAVSGKSQSSEQQMLLDEFYKFLEFAKDKLDGTTSLHMMASHGRLQELLLYADNIKKDYHRVIQYYLQTKQWKSALQVLAREETFGKKKPPTIDPNLFYKYTPLLIEQLPTETVNLIIAHHQHLNPRNLIPALMRYQRVWEIQQHQEQPDAKKSNNEAIRYLDYVVTVQGNKDPAIHNYLLSLYTSQQDERPLLNFLKQKDTIVDLQYALRLCAKKGKIQAQVLIFSKMKLYEEAVNLALTIPDINLAKNIADKPMEDHALKETDSDELRKKLWLRIARYVVETEKQIKKATAFLKDCSLLKIEDILPFFPDFVLIDDFQEEICGSLLEYNKHLLLLQDEMAETTESAELIREDFKNIKNHYIQLSTGGANTTTTTTSSKCSFCKYPLLTSSFYLFPCSHAFHCNCLQKEVKKHLNKQDLQQVKSIEAQLLAINSKSQSNQQPIPSFLNPSAPPVAVLGLSLFSDSNEEEGQFGGSLNIGGPGSSMGGGASDEMDDTNGVDGEYPSSQKGLGGINFQATDDEREQHLKNQLDNILASECLLCGFSCVEDVDSSFIDPGKFSEINSWKLPSPHDETW